MIAIGNRVDFTRPGYQFKDGEVLTLDIGQNKAVVQWVDEHGWVHQAPCDMGLLTVTNGAAQRQSEAPAEAASA